jgi:protein-tyrosine-phosphatase/predicted ATP-grasp superfamily ATP-dependent carboligase
MTPRSGDGGAALLIGEEPRVLVTAARSLHRHGIRADVATFGPPSMALRSRAIGAVVSLGSHGDEPDHVLAALLDQLDGGRYGVVVPCSDTALGAVARFYTELAGLARVACPPPHVINRVLVKSLTLEAGRAAGVAIPRAFPIERSSDLERWKTIVTFPVILKPRRKMEAAPFKVRRLDSWEQLCAALETDPELPERCLIQEYCPGEGVGVEVLMHAGEPLMLFQHRRVREWPSSGGVSVIAEAERVDPGLAAQAIRLLQTVEWEGAAMVEFRCDPSTGRTALMEINGRYWGSLPLTVQAGLDVPFYHWQLVHGWRPRIPAAYRVGVRMRWTGGALRRLEDAARNPGPGRPGMLREAGQLLCAWPTTKDALWSWRDPLPGLADGGGAALGLVWRGALRMLKRTLPRDVVDVLKLARIAGVRPAMASARARARRALRPGSGLRVPPDQIRSVLFVCHGNIIRSPMAAALLARMLAGAPRSVDVLSAGLHAHPFNGPDLRAIQLAADFGVSLLHHRAQPMSKSLAEKGDLIIVMDHRNEAELLARYPECRAKVHLLAPCLESASGPRTLEVADPYLGTIEDVRRCFRELESHVTRLARFLSGAPVPAAAEQGRSVRRRRRATAVR